MEWLFLIYAGLALLTGCWCNVQTVRLYRMTRETLELTATLRQARLDLERTRLDLQQDREDLEQTVAACLRSREVQSHVRYPRQ